MQKFVVEFDPVAGKPDDVVDKNNRSLNDNFTMGTLISFERLQDVGHIVRFANVLCYNSR